MRLYKFRNINASSIRTIMVARCEDTKPSSSGSIVPSSQDLASQAESRKRKKSTLGIESTETSHSECSWGKASRRQRANQHSQKMQVYSDGDRGMRLLEVDSESHSHNCTIQYNINYRLAECQGDTDEIGKVEQANVDHGESEFYREEEGYLLDVEDWDQALSGDEIFEPETENSDAESAPEVSPQPGPDEQYVYFPSHDPAQSKVQEEMGHSSTNPPPGIGAACSSSCPQVCGSSSKSKSCTSSLDASASISTEPPSYSADKYLIFTTGLKTFTPHQIGIKKIEAQEVTQLLDTSTPVRGPPPHVAVDIDGSLHNDYDTVDHLIELHGHIIGMCLSPDHR